MTTVDLAPLTGHDVPAAADLHLRAFPRFFLSRLGAPFLREFYAGFVDDPDAVTVVSRGADGRLLGVVVGTVTPDGFFGRLLRRRGHRMAVAAVRPALRDPRAVGRLVRGIAYRGTSRSRRAGRCSARSASTRRRPAAVTAGS
ncbi:hypothetical protein [Micromonospora echinospora]|uniref:hypothetical protein n=1 Tax=Micromonospora echinospora TaxID=1877 RepID=UPI003A8942D0